MKAEKQKRMTKQRKLIYDILASTKTHPSADWIYEEARKVMPYISPGTVYRNLQVLEEENLVKQLNYGKAKSRFDGNPHNHYHFICMNCGEIFDFAPDKDIISQETLAQLPGEVSSYRLEFYGNCHKCLK